MTDWITARSWPLPQNSISILPLELPIPLDLDALVGASLSLGLSEETDSELMNNPVCLLEALRSVGDKVALFCEDGQIHMPSKVTPLYILLEKIVFSVKTARRKGITAFPSFHPKFWLIRYKNNTGELRYRVIVLSRNLTFDRSWDITYFMDGKVVDAESDKNERRFAKSGRGYTQKAFRRYKRRLRRKA